MTTTEPRRVPAPPMPRHDRVSTGATAGIIGAAITLASALVVQLVVQPDTTVSDEQFSYPWPSTALIPVSILYVAAHVLVASGLVALRRSAAAGPSRGGGTGLRLALAGTGFLAAGEVGSIIVRNRLVDDTSATIVGLAFALGTLLSAIGLLLAGRAVLAAGVWTGWRRWTALGTGAWTAMLIGLAMTTLLPLGVAGYGAGLLAIGIALRTQPSYRADAPTHEQVT